MSLQSEENQTDQLFATTSGTFQLLSGLPVSVSANQGRKRSLNVGATPVRKRRSLSSSTSELSIISDATSILCTTVPDEYNDKEVLRRHFSRFGKVVRVQCNVPKKSATVRFSTHEHAATARAKGKFLRGKEIHIYFKKKIQTSDKIGKSVFELDTNQTKSPEASSSQTSTGGKVALGRTSGPRQHAIISRVKTRSIYAKTDEEKLLLLERIDKLLRSRLVKKSDLSQATVTTGTCPDMCPEKERYLRQQRNLLSTYEMTQHKRMDHQRMVKEYSRSSADQEEPLSHELRPSKVLRITMDYMLTHVMRDIDYDKTAEWYDFVWNRTRAIRKEISIQQANDGFAIEVTEECARFHICCGHELCEADLLNFDPKINNENLEKTMKTILDMYSDVRARSTDDEDLLKNEPEFRAYFVLLNINRSADVLRELQNMSLRVRYSPEVKLAVSAVAAMQSKNFSSFFKAVGHASYLQAALLHRYFTQIRRQAVLVMAKAYKSHKGVCIIPTNDMMRKLLFNGIAELSEFCNSLAIPIRDGNVELSKSEEYSSNGMPLFCCQEVRYKMGGQCLGEMISHGRHPTFSLHEPLSSFDHEDRYIGPHAHLLNVTASSSKPPEKKAPDQIILSDQINPLKLLQSKGISNNVVKVIAKELFQEIINEIVGQVGGEVIGSAHQDLATKAILNHLMDDTITEEVKQSVCNTLLERKMEEQKKQEEAEKKDRNLKVEAERRLQEKRQKEESERLMKEEIKSMNHAVGAIAVELEEKVANDIIHETAHFIMREERLDHLTALVSGEVIDFSVREILEDVATSVMKKATKMKHVELCGKLQTKLTGIHWRKWRKELAKMKKRRWVCETFPPTPLSRNVCQQVQGLLPDDRGDFIDTPSNVQASRRLSMKALPSLLQRHTAVVENIEKEVPRAEEEYFNRMSLTQIVFTSFNYDVIVEESARIFWKLSFLCTPASMHSAWGYWLTYKLGLRDKDDSEPSTGVNFEDMYTSTMALYHVHVCCKVLGRKRDAASDIVGTSAFVFLLTGKDQWSKLKDLVKDIFNSIPPNPPAPLLVLQHGCDLNEAKLVEELHLPTWNHVMSPVKVVSLVDDVRSNCQLLSTALHWLASQTKPPPRLQCASLRNVIEEQLSVHLLSPLCRHEVKRREHWMPSMDPCLLVKMYNNILDQVEAVITDKHLMEVSWPAEEYRATLGGAQPVLPPIGWNTESGFNEISFIINLLKLPAFPAIEQYDQIEDLQKAIDQYCYLACGGTASLANKMISFYKCADVEEFVQTYPWQRLINVMTSLLFQQVLYTKRGEVVVAFQDSSFANIQLHPKFPQFFHHLEADHDYLQSKPSEVGGLERANPSHALEVEAQSTLKTTPNAPNQESCQELSSWMVADDTSRETANQVAGLRMNVRNEVVESRRFFHKLEKQIEEAHFLNLFFNS